MVKNSLYFFVLIFTISCSPIQRHTRLVKKFPHVHTNDTIVFTDTLKISVPEIKKDTVFYHETFYTQLLDTIVIHKDRLKVQLMRVKDSIYIEGKCDTIKVEKVVIRKIPIKYYETESSWLKWVIIIAIGTLVLISIFRRTDKT